jgi:hypothetical protein
MTTHPASNEQRRAQRKRVNFTAVVTDVISGKPLGFLGNLSAGGMLLICQQPPRTSCSYRCMAWARNRTTSKWVCRRSGTSGRPRPDRSGRASASSPSARTTRR